MSNYNTMSFKIFTALVISFMMISISAYSQSEYLTQKRFAFEIQGALAKSGDVTSSGLGFSFSLKSALDIELSFGGVKDSDTNLSGDFVSVFTTFYIANQRMGRGANFGLIFGGTEVNYDVITGSAYGGGIIVSGRKNLTDKTGLIPSASFLYFPINDITSDEQSGNAGDQFGVLSLKLGAFNNFNSNNFLFSEPSLGYNTENDEPSFSITVGIIF